MPNFTTPQCLPNMKIKDLFTEDVRKLLSEDSLDAIQTAFENKLKGSIDLALEAQDTLYADQLKTLVSTIDKDHTKKMKKLVEAVDRGNAQKLVKVVNKYERDSLVESKKFKAQIVNTISAYLDEFLNESISVDDLRQAVDNKTAYNVLEGLRTALSVDSALMKESVKEAVMDGKNKLVEKETKLTDLSAKYNTLMEENESLKKNMFLESKLSGFNSDKKTFLKKAFTDKPLTYIQENMDYAIRLFDKKEKEKLVSIREEAISQRKVKPDFVKTEKVITENVNTNIADGNSLYVDELKKVFGGKR